MSVARTGFAFSPNGEYACWLQSDPTSTCWSVFGWYLDRPVKPTLRTGPSLSGPTAQLLALDEGGGVLLAQPSQRRAEIWRYTADPHDPAERLANLPGAGHRLIGHPDPDVLAVVLLPDGRDGSQLALLTGEPPYLQTISQLPGRVGRTTWLDTAGSVLGVDLATAGGVHTESVDLVNGTHEPMWPDRPTFRLRLVAPVSGLVVVEDPAGRLGCLDQFSSEARWPAALRDDRPQAPLAIDPAGERVLLRVDHGARSGLVVADPVRDQRIELPIPSGVVGGVAHWSARGLRFPFAGPGHPAGLAELSAGAHDAVFGMLGSEVPEPTNRAGRLGRPALERFRGPSGPVDAVGYGDWRRARRVVLALHGGPDAAWRLLDDGPLPGLGDSGVCVLAVNPRGSRGAPGGGSRALHGAWGGPDLADVRAVAHAVSDERHDRPSLFGTSYGAFLGLLALAADPDLWERAVLVAPFLSGARLHADGSARAREVVERFGGRTTYVDHLGPRDALALADRIRADLLVIHGTDDQVVPVSHSRTLVARLRTYTATVDYREIPGAGHHPLDAPDGPVTSHTVCAFLGAPRSRHASSVATASEPRKGGVRT